MAETNNTAAAPANDAKPAVVETDAQKVFAGNLSFATTEEQLKQIFAGCGTVTRAQIITRGTRSLGYGFVTFSSEAMAQKAVSTLNKTEIGGREINVEQAKPQATPSPADAEKRDAAKTAGRTRGRGGRTTNSTARCLRADEGEEGTAASKPAEGAESAAKPKKTRKPKTKTEANGDAAATPAVDADKTAPKPKAERAPRPPKGEAPPGVPSKTLVFVTNLPFDFSDEQLGAIFEGLDITSAKVVKRPNTNKTKGFGFVDLKDEANQAKAIEKFNGKEVEGREIAIKIAIQGEKKTAAGGKEAEVAALNEASKPEATSPAAPAV